MRQSHIAVIGAPMDLGAGRRGVDMGPSAIRYAGLQARLEELGYVVEDRGNIVAADMAALQRGDAQHSSQICTNFVSARCSNATRLRVVNTACDHEHACTI